VAGLSWRPEQQRAQWPAARGGHRRPGGRSRATSRLESIAPLWIQQWKKIIEIWLGICFHNTGQSGLI
jgi:hypothetical protein